MKYILLCMLFVLWLLCLATEMERIVSRYEFLTYYIEGDDDEVYIQSRGN